MKSLSKFIFTALLTTAFIIPMNGYAFTKTEAIYSNLKYDGSVNNHIKNLNKGDVLYQTYIKDIKNVNGYEKFSRDNSDITWKSTGNDIYYQGSVSSSLPIKVSAKYYLNGQEVKPSKIKNKKGNIKIVFDFVNSDYNYDFSNYEEISVNLDELSNDYKITKAALYHFTGKTNYSIEIDCDDYIKIILDNVSIDSTKSSINVVNSKGVYIELVGNNDLSDSTNNTDDTDAVIYSSDDLIIEGSGTLNITANYKDGIASKDDLIIKSGTYKISATDDGIRGKDLVLIMDGNFDITSNGDAIKTTNDTDSDNHLITGNMLTPWGALF